MVGIVEGVFVLMLRRERVNGAQTQAQVQSGCHRRVSWWCESGVLGFCSAQCRGGQMRIEANKKNKKKREEYRIHGKNERMMKGEEKSLYKKYKTKGKMIECFKQIMQTVF